LSSICKLVEEQKLNQKQYDANINAEYLIYEIIFKTNEFYKGEKTIIEEK